MLKFTARSRFALKLIILLFSIATPSLIANTDREFTLEGIYFGEMKLNDGDERTIPLQLSLTITDEFVDAPIDSPFTYQKVIHASFIADDEGGPYPFSKVRYDITTGKIDFRYNRPSVSVTPTSPFNLRYIGYIDDNATINGRILSGIKGQIGTFTVTRSDEINYMTTQEKYFGRWAGDWSFFNDGKKGRTIAFVMVLEQALTHTINPPNYELDYTSGRTGYADFDSYLMPFSKVVIDYLRRTIIINSTNASGSVVTMIGSLDDDGSITGTANSTFKGKTAEFTMTRVTE